MKMRFPTAAPAAALALALAAPLAAQEMAGTAAEGDQAAVLTPIERWQADPATVFDAAEIDPADFRWIARPVIVFADAAVDPAYRRQLEELTLRPAALAERDVVIILDTDPDMRSPARLAHRPRDFEVVLIDKDGVVKLARPSPLTVREITRAIDASPIRQQELRDRRGTTSEG